MYKKVLIDGTLYPIDYRKSIGIGGEAVVVKLPFKQTVSALKLTKTPDHPDLQGRPQEQAQARRLIQLQQLKLPAFPQGLPDQVITPDRLAYDPTGSTIVGYLMRYIQDAELLIRYTQPSFRSQGVQTEQVLQMLLTLGNTINGVHKKGVVIGDLSELNVLITNHTTPWLIDADSFGYGQWPPMAYTKRFVDPLLCDHQRGVSHLELILPQNKESDWRIYTMLVMMCLIYVDPYSGVFEPDKISDLVPDELRPLHHITVFHPQVIYPDGLPHYSILPDDLLELFKRMFIDEWRGVFPLSVLEDLRETQCKRCGKVHYRSVCPHCNQPAPAALKRRVYTHRRVNATEVLNTSGHVIYATQQSGVFRYLYHENGRYKRGMFRMDSKGDIQKQSDLPVAQGVLNPLRRYRISGDSTIIGQDGQIVVIRADGSEERYSLDSFGSLPLFDTNSKYIYWVEDGVLYREGGKLGNLTLPPKRIGTVLTDQTLFWVGKDFGFGFYRIGNLQVGFVFDAEQPGINDTLELPQIRGQLVDSTCVFADDLCYFFTTTRASGQTMNQCTVITRTGEVFPLAEAAFGDKGWLGSIRGKTAINFPDPANGRNRNFLFSPSSNGIVQLEFRDGSLVQRAEYPETAPFVEATNTHLQIAPEGIYAAQDKSIYLLQLR